ncbi:MAG: hypothetical protein HY975_02845, partial [Candidatus Kerfeldbacteria bacterium]|nr:hypothetical protein [Candidatus Kerfeldbacteria bacterium]
ITVMWTPDVIVLGGSVMVKLWPHRPLIRDGLRYRTNPPEIIRSKLGDAAGLYGALALTTSADRKVAR